MSSVSRSSPLRTTQRARARRVERAETLRQDFVSEDLETEDTLLLTSPDEATAQGAGDTLAPSFYFKVNPDGANYASWSDGALHPVRVSVHYLDEGTETLDLKYSSNGTSENGSIALVTKTNTGEYLWANKKISLRLTHAVYAAFDNADFRVVSSGSGSIVNGARLRETSLKIKVNWKGNTFDEDLQDNRAAFGNDPDLIGNWAISPDYLVFDTGTDATSAGLAPENYPFFAGATYANRANAPFRVTPAGHATLVSASIANWDVGVVDAYTISADNGKVRLNSQTPAISLGNLVNGYLSGKGFWVGKHSGDWKFHLGDPANDVLYWDGSNLWDTGHKIGGTVGGQINGWKVKAGYIESKNANIRLDANSQYIAIGAPAPSAYLTGTGFWVGDSGGTYKFHLGDPAGAYLAWNGSKLIKRRVKHKGTNELGDSDDGVQDTDLLVVYGHMQSDDWVAGATGSGWRISNSGNAHFKNVNIRGTLTASVFAKGMIEAKAGTLIVAKSAGKLNANMVVPSSGTWTMTIEDPPDTGWLFDNGDILQIKETQGSISTTWFTVTRGTQGSGNQTYTCTFANGSRPNTYAKGNVVVDFGVANQGWLEMSADGTGAPYYSVRTHAGAPWATVTERGRFGNMNGAFGVSGNYYGFGIGDYAGGNYLRYETNGGFRLLAGGSAVGIDADGIGLVEPAANSNSPASSIVFRTALGGAIVGGLSNWYQSSITTRNLTLFANYDYFGGGAGAAVGGKIILSSKASDGTTAGLSLFARLGVSSLDIGVDQIDIDTATITGHIKATDDNTYDIGASGANRPRHLYVASNVVAAGKVGIGTASPSQSLDVASGNVLLAGANAKLYMRGGGGINRSYSVYDETLANNGTTNFGGGFITLMVFDGSNGKTCLVMCRAVGGAVDTVFNSDALNFNIGSDAGLVFAIYYAGGSYYIKNRSGANRSYVAYAWGT